MNFDLIHPISKLIQKNFTHFKIDDHDWVEISKIHFGYSNYCIASTEEKIFTVLGDYYSLADVTKDEEITENELIQKSSDDFFKLIKIQGAAMW